MLYHVQDLQRIPHYLDLDSAKLLANALASSLLDYCNSFSYGNADTILTQLQCIQNRVTRVVTMSPPFPLLHSLHWLPIKFRILFTISLLTYKTLHGKQPVYLHSILVPPPSSCSLRSSNGISLLVPMVKIGARAFHSCAPSLWNNLPLSVRSATSVPTFKKYLKKAEILRECHTEQRDWFVTWLHIDCDVTRAFMHVVFVSVKWQ